MFTLYFFVITIFAFRGIINHSNLNFISHVKYYTRGRVELKGNFLFAPFLFCFSILFVSCNFNNDSDDTTEIDCSAEIASRAFRFAELYKDSDTVY